MALEILGPLNVQIMFNYLVSSGDTNQILIIVYRVCYLSLMFYGPDAAFWVFADIGRVGTREFEGRGWLYISYFD